MAGQEAEEECLGRCSGGDGEDERKITSALDDLLDADADTSRYERRLRKTTRSIVRRHGAAIERVAKLLLEQGIATATEVEREINAARGSEP